MSNEDARERLVTRLYVSWFCRHCGAALEPIGEAVEHQLRKHRGCLDCRHITRELLDELITERGHEKGA